MIDVPSKPGMGYDRPGSVAFADVPATASLSNADAGDAASGTSNPGTAGSVLLVDGAKGRKSRPRTVTHSEEVQYETIEYEPAVHETEVLAAREQQLQEEHNNTK